jgi:hypothetical protein
VEVAIFTGHRALVVAAAFLVGFQIGWLSTIAAGAVGPGGIGIHQGICEGERQEGQ